MRRRIPLTVFSFALLLMVSLVLPKQGFTQAQPNAKELGQILEQVISLPELQKHYPLNQEGDMKQVHIMQFPVSFPAGMDLSKDDLDVVFMQRSEIENSKIDAYFMIRSISTKQGKTKLVGHYFYNYNYNTKKADYIAISADFIKSASGVEISNSKLEGGAI